MAKRTKRGTKAKHPSRVIKQNRPWWRKVNGEWQKVKGKQPKD